MFHKEGYQIIIISLLITSSLIIAFEYLINNNDLKFFFKFLSFLLFVLILQFFRNPKRTALESETQIIAPADGKIVIIKEVNDGFDPAEVEGYEEFNKNYEPKEEKKEDILDEVKDVDKWNQWVDAAEKEAIKEDQKEKDKDKEYVDTKNRIFYGEELKQIDEAQKKTVSGTNYITKVSNKQVRQTTNPEDSDQT